MMTAENTNIVTAYETLGLKPAEIATEFNMDELAVKATLMQFSGKFRADLRAGEDKSLDFGDTDLEEANQTIVRLMRHSEDENLQFRAAKFIRNDKKGRLDIVKGIGNLNVNISLFNQHLKAAQRAKELSRSSEAQDKLTKQLQNAEVVDV